MIRNTAIQRHALPGDSGATETNTAWLKRQNAYERGEIKHLVAFKRNALGIREDGVYSKNTSYT